MLADNFYFYRALIFPFDCNQSIFIEIPNDASLV